LFQDLIGHSGNVLYFKKYEGGKLTLLLYNALISEVEKRFIFLCSICICLNSVYDTTVFE
jgi:hypothetical protein